MSTSRIAGNGPAWAIIAAWTAVTLASLLAPSLVSFNLARYVTLALLTAFTLLHGARRYGAGGIAAYFLVAVVVTNVFENLSIVTGFPFGAYHHTANMGPKLFHVPLIVGPIFAVAGYLAWVLAGILLGETAAGARRGVALARPLVAALVTTSWDLCVDAIGGTVNRDWVWAGGGGWFGVPWLNFFGWVLTTWVFFQLFAIYLARRAAAPRPVDDTAYWWQAVVFWALIAAQFPLLAVIGPDVSVTDPAGTAWRTGHLFDAMAIASVFTMGFTALVAACLLARRAPAGRAPSV